MTGDTDRRETRGRHRVDDPLNFDDIIQFEWIDLPDDTQSDDIMQFGWIDFLDGRTAVTRVPIRGTTLIDGAAGTLAQAVTRVCSTDLTLYKTNYIYRDSGEDQQSSPARTQNGS